MKIRTSVSRIVFRDYILDDNIIEFMEKNNIYSFRYNKTEILDINEEQIIESYLKAFPNSKDEPDYWYANELYDKVQNLTLFIGGDKQDMNFEIAEPGYPCDIPRADRIFKTVDEFRRWMLEKGKNNI